MHKPMTEHTERTAREKLAISGASLFLVGLVTGFWAAAALTGVVQLKNPHLALAAHLNGLFGGIWLLVVAFTFEFLRYDEKGLCRLALWVSVPAWANWAVTSVASVLGVTGLTYSHEMSNNVIAALLHMLVVIPALIGSSIWVWGFFRSGALPASRS